MEKTYLKQQCFEVVGKVYLYNKVNYIKRWTNAAVECYLRGCRCNNAGNVCFYNKFFHDKPYKCRMKETVLMLVEIIGTPPKSLIKAAKRGNYGDNIFSNDSDNWVIED